MKPSPRAFPALAVLVVLSVVPAVLVLGLMAALMVAVTSGAGWPALLLLGVVTVAAAVGVGRATVLVGRHGAQPPVGVALTRSAQPRLWAVVDELAAAAGTRTPDEIRLVPDSKAALSENARLLGLRSGCRRLYVGVPLVLGLTELQLRATIAHELARYGGAGGVVFRASQSLRRLVRYLGNDSWAGRLTALYTRPYDVVARGVIREQNVDADRLSAQLAGRSAALAAVREVAALDRGWHYFLDRYVDLGIEERLRPMAVFDGFERFLAEPARQLQLAEVRSAPPDGEAGADPQLPVAERIAVLEAAGDPVADDYEPALGLLDDPRRALGELETWMFEDSDLVPASWDEIVAAGAAGVARRDAARLTLAMEDSGVARPATLITVFDAIRRGEVEAMVEPLAGPDDTHDQRLALAERLLTRLVTSALLDSGRASYKLNWAGPGQLVGADGREVAPDRLVARAIEDPNAAYTLQGWLTACGVPPDYRAHTDGNLPGADQVDCVT